MRAKIVLMAAQGLDNDEIAARLVHERGAALSGTTWPDGVVMRTDRSASGLVRRSGVPRTTTSNMRWSS